MKYNWEIRAVADQSQTIEDKHESFLNGLDGLPEPWAVSQRLPAPDPGGGLSGSLKVAKLLGKGLRGDLVYQFRRPFRDEASQDDYLNVVFNPTKINYKQLVSSVFLKYVGAFGGYYAEIADDEFIFMDYEARRQHGVDKRHGIYRLAPVAYIGQELCRRAFGITPEQVVDRLQGSVEEVRLALDGVFIVLTSEPLPAAQVDDLCWKAKALLERP
jgi:hypothetical protein